MRKTYLRKGQSLDDSGTYQIDINIVEQISQLIIFVEATNGATSNQGVMLPTDIDKIELTDGASVIYSMSGIMSRCLSYHESGKMPPHFYTEAAAGVQKYCFIINFGRFPGDTEYFFDPAKYKNPQLKITTSLTISATAGFATGTGSLDVIANVFSDSVGSSKGFFMAKNIYDFTSVASGDETIDMPIDYPYRMILQRAYETGIALDTDISNIKLTCDNDFYIPVDLEMDHIVRLNKNRLGLHTEHHKLLRTDADAVVTIIPNIEQALANASLDLDIASVDDITVNQVTLQLLSVTVVPAIAKSVTDTDILLAVQGSAPYFSVSLPFGDLVNEANYFESNRYKSIDLKLTQGGAGAACSTVIQQIMK